MNNLSIEKFIESLGCEVYPVTILKFLLNKRKIMSYFMNAIKPDFEIRGTEYKIDNSDCQNCKDKKELGLDILCRQHTSIQRVLNGDNVAFDIDTQTYFHKNEIFKKAGSRIVIIYCPHTKLISGDLTKAKVRKINAVTIEDKNFQELPEFKNVREFFSSFLLGQKVECWFDDQFTIVTDPKDGNFSDFSLTLNH